MLITCSQAAVHQAVIWWVGAGSRLSLTEGGVTKTWWFISLGRLTSLARHGAPMNDRVMRLLAGPDGIERSLCPQHWLVSLLVFWLGPKACTQPHLGVDETSKCRFLQRQYFNSPFLADRTNGRAIGTVLRLSVVCLSVMLCIVAKRCVLEQKLLLRACRKSYMRNRLVPKWMTLTFV